MWMCEQQGIFHEDGGVIRAFREKVRQGWRGEVKGPFNIKAREMAGLSPGFYEDFRGELGMGEAGMLNMKSCERVQSDEAILDGWNEVQGASATVVIPVQYERNAQQKSINCILIKPREKEEPFIGNMMGNINPACNVVSLQLRGEIA